MLKLKKIKGWRTGTGHRALEPTPEPAAPAGAAGCWTKAEATNIPAGSPHTVYLCLCLCFRPQTIPQSQLS